MARLTPEIKAFIDTTIKGTKSVNYITLVKRIAQRYGVKVSKSTISKRAQALKITFRRGRKRIFPVGKRPGRSIFLDCAGGFFLKGAELEMGLLATINRMLKMNTESAKAKKALKLAQQINALLLYAPIFGLKTAADIAGYNRAGLLYLSEQKELPSQEAITQYLDYLANRELLVPMIKEVTTLPPEALLMGIDFKGQTFYVDAQCCTVWPAQKVPPYFSVTISKVKSYVRDFFQSPSAQRPLILQTAPGYTFLPTEMFNLIQCFERTKEEPISRLAITDKFGADLAVWYDIRPGQKCYFIAPLSPWQYARLAGTQIIHDFRHYIIGPEKESMAVAEARINLFNPQLNKTIRLRAALVRRKEERLALITNISPRQERYIRKIVEQYFTRWPQPKKLTTYYDLLERAHEDILSRSRSWSDLTSLTTVSYSQNPLEMFRLFLEHLHRYALRHFFPSEDEAQTFQSMCEKFYRQSGYLKIKRNCWEIILRAFAQTTLQKSAQFSCQKFNQSGIEFPAQRRLNIYLR